MLIPGTNEITDEEWDAIQPLISTEVKNKEIVQLTVESKKAKNGKAWNLCDVPSNIARDIITKCSNPATLKKWFKEETRDEVLLAVTKRMRKLKLDPDDLQKEIDKEGGEETSTEDDDLTDDTSSEDEDEGGEDDLDAEDENSEGEGGEDFDLTENDEENN
jgi:transposase